MVKSEIQWIVDAYYMLKKKGVRPPVCSPLPSSHQHQNNMVFRCRGSQALCSETPQETTLW
jgi:hypothetical protein